MKNLENLFDYFRDNRELPHKSMYHHEGYGEHCLLTIASALDADASRPVLLAAALCDIAKPRTYKFDLLDNAYFDGHENVTIDEATKFLPESDKDFNYVMTLIHYHMLPYKLETDDEEEKQKSIKEINDVIAKYSAIYPNFEKDLFLLHLCNQQASLQREISTEDIEQMEKAKEWLLTYDLEEELC